MTVNAIYNQSKQCRYYALNKENHQFFLKLVILIRQHPTCGFANLNYIFNIHANINGATMVASDSTINLGVWMSSLPQVIFSLGTAPE
jgi:hypothetical protein